MDEVTVGRGAGGAHLFAPSPHRATCVLILMYMIEVEQSECRLSTMLVSSVFSIQLSEYTLAKQAALCSHLVQEKRKCSCLVPAALLFLTFE